MATLYSPRVVTGGLVMAVDAANIKSFRGPAQTNILTGINYSYGNTDTSTFKITNGTEVVNIPSVGTRTVKYVDIYNDYNGGSGNCCPSPYNFGDVSVSGNTVYTYSILYKTTTGYTHPNYMYRYEYNGSTYLTEAGVHSTSNRTHLGDGWYHAWGQFTTQASTTRLTGHLFHYEYATYNRIYVAYAQLTQGTYIGVARHMLEPAQVRGSTVATGGGLVDLSNNNNHGQVINGPTFDGGNGGSLVFSGVSDYLPIENPSATGQWTPTGGGLNNITLEIWIKTSDTSGYYLSKPWNGNGEYNYVMYNGGLQLVTGNQSYTLSVPGFADNNWHQVVYWISPSQVGYYIDGIRLSGSANHAITNNTPTSGNSGLPLSVMTLYPYGVGWGGNTGFSVAGNVAIVKIYNKILSATEVVQNFNATRARFGI